MRIKSFFIRNYKGLREVAAADLDTEPAVFLSGRNGTGKSLVLEAITAAWNHRWFQVERRVGPWGDEAVIQVEVALSEEEGRAVRDWHDPAGTTDPPIVVRTETHLNNRGGNSTTGSDGRFIGHDTVFRRQHPFAIIDLLPATRHVPIGQGATIDPQLFGEERTQQERLNWLDSFMGQRALTQFPGVKSFLATQHYLDMLEREAGRTGNGFATISDAFHEATGKRITEPEVDLERGVAIRVRTRADIAHDLDDLSSGEQEALALMYFVRRLSHRGGVLCIDEPEQHLHPALQASFFTIAMGLAERAQLLVVTHSIKLLSIAPTSALLRIEDPADTPGNQVARATDWPARAQLFADVGVNAANLVQNDFLLVVEGETDEQWIQGIFPVLIARATVVVAGDASRVEAMRELLEKADQPLPWLCVRDRDFLDDEECAERMARPGLHVLPRRDIENLALDPRLVARCFTNAGRETSEAEATELLTTLAATQRNEVLEHLLERRLAKDFKLEPDTSGDRWANAKARYAAISATNSDREGAFDNALTEERAKLDAEWDGAWPTLVDGKVMLRMLVPKSPFHTGADLIAALQRTCAEESDVRPDAWAAVGVRLATLL